MRVADAISSNPICCTASCPVQTAAKLMQQVDMASFLCWKRMGAALWV